MLKRMLLAASLFSGQAMAADLTPSGADDTAAFNKAVAALCAPGSSDRMLNLSAGTFIFYSAPAMIPCAVTVKGQGKGATTLVRQYSAPTFLYWGRGDIDHAGGGVRDMTIAAGPQSAGGIAIYVKATQDADCKVLSYNRHEFSIDNVLIGRIDAASSWYIGVYLDGAENTAAGGCAPGARGIDVFRTSVSGVTAGQFWVYTGRGIYFNDVDCYIPLGGSYNGITLDGDTQSVMAWTRTCPMRQQTRSFGGVLNGVPIP